MFLDGIVHTVHLAVSEADAWRLAYASVKEESVKRLQVPNVFEGGLSVEQFQALRFGLIWGGVAGEA